MAFLMTSPKFSAWTSAGLPGAGYKLYTYTAGTTTPKATYTDTGGGTPNANPTILDARGEASIYLATDAFYKFVLKTDADVTVWTVDNVGASDVSTAFAQEHDSSTGAHEFPGTRAAGDIIYDTGTAIARLAKGTSGQILQIGASAPAWAYDTSARNNITGLVVSRSSDTLLAVSAGRAVVDDNTNVREWNLATAITVAHGLSGSALTMVYVYLDPDAATGGTWPALNANNFVVSTTAPTWSYTKGGLYHPTAGSTDQRFVGAWQISATNTSAAHLATDGNTVYYKDRVSIASGQTGGPNTHALTNYVPAVADITHVLLDVDSTYNTNPATIFISKYGSSPASNGWVVHTVSSTMTRPETMLWMPIGLNSAAPSVVLYVSAAVSDYQIRVNGWRLPR